MSFLTILFSLITVMRPSIQSCIHFCPPSSLSNALKSTLCLYFSTHMWPSISHKKNKLKKKKLITLFWQIKDFFSQCLDLTFKHNGAVNTHLFQGLYLTTTSFSCVLLLISGVSLVAYQCRRHRFDPWAGRTLWRKK